MYPRPYWPPTPSAAFLTLGTTTTHLALVKNVGEMPVSLATVISLSTVAAFLSLSSSAIARPGKRTTLASRPAAKVERNIRASLSRLLQRARQIVRMIRSKRRFGSIDQPLADQTGQTLLERE